MEAPLGKMQKGKVFKYRTLLLFLVSIFPAVVLIAV